MPQDTATTDLDVFMAKWVANQAAEFDANWRDRRAAAMAFLAVNRNDGRAFGLKALCDAYDRAAGSRPRFSDAALDRALRSWFGIKPGDRRGDWSDAERESMRAAILAALTENGE